ncbi:MAG TPA: C45 family peptidase [Nocardioidaceae bacterium]|nr:C45 family peptidase [Nocardioidaceae bacterium]
MDSRAYTSSVLPPRQRGQELGERFAAEITRTVARYRTLFAVRSAQSAASRARGPFDVDLWSQRAWRSITRRAPVHAEEIAGIADGAGLTPEQVASVNARTELLVAANPTGATECSTVVSSPRGLPPVAVQTWDWYDAMSDGWFEWTIPHPDGRVVRTVTEYGILAKIGVNDRGVGVMLNMLHHENDADAVAEGEIGHPVHLLSRAILDDAATTGDAVRIASEARTTASTSLTAVDPTGAAASVELFPDGPGVLEPTDGLLVRTNHFMSGAGRAGDLGLGLGASTGLRRTHLLETFAARTPSTVVEVLQAMTHHDGDGGVCRHNFLDPDPVLWHRTLATVAIDVTAGTLDVRDGGPCGHRWASVEQPA